AAKLAVVTQSDGDMVEERLRELLLLKRLPGLEHDAIGQAICTEAARVTDLRDQLRGPRKRWEQIGGLERVRQRHLEEGIGRRSNCRLWESTTGKARPPSCDRAKAGRGRCL